MKVHDNSMEALENISLSPQDYFNLQSQEMKGASDVKFISCMYLFGDTLYIGTRSSKLYIFDIDPNPSNLYLKNQRIVMPHCETISHVAANQRFFITVPQSDDETSVSIWGTKNLQFEVALRGHNSQVSKVLFLNDKDYVVTSSWDNTVKVWCLKAMKQQPDLLVNSAQSEYPILVVEQINQEILAYGGDDCYITLWNFMSNQEITKVFGHAGSVTFLLMENSVLMSAGGDCKVKFWSISDRIEHQSVNEKDKGWQQEQVVGNTQKKQAMMEEEGQANEKEMNEGKKSNNEGYEQKQDNEEAICKLKSQIKMNYDASVYMAILPNTRAKFFIDRHGNGFVLENNIVVEGNNKFSYGVNVTGVVNFADYLYISTTKGQVKRCIIEKVAVMPN